MVVAKGAATDQDGPGWTRSILQEGSPLSSIERPAGPAAGKNRPEKTRSITVRLISDATTMDFAALRRRLEEAIPVLNVSQALQVFLVRLLARQVSKAGLIQLLQALDEFLAHDNETGVALLELPRLSKIAVESIDEGGGLLDLISLDNVLYAFGGGAISRGLIRAPWGRQTEFRPDRVYLRTASGLFFTRRSFSGFLAQVDANLFLRVHQSIAVNVRKAAKFDQEGRLREVGVRIQNGSIEWLTIGRREYPEFRKRFGLPGRRVEGSLRHD